jgi:hypothetical protein
VLLANSAGYLKFAVADDANGYVFVETKGLPREISQRRRSRTFFCSRLKKLSVAAAAPAAPTRQIDPTMS